jgi:hypothetical protein
LHYLFEDADFSTYRIKKLIAEGEKDAERAISNHKDSDDDDDDHDSTSV